MKLIRKRRVNIFSFSLVAAFVLSACGGGGSPGETHEQYQIYLGAENDTLPLNVEDLAPGIGSYAPYTTTLTVSATEGKNGPSVPNGTEFGCALTGNVGVGALYYLDGEHDGDSEDGAQGYRSVTLESNAGAATFHFHAGNVAGEAEIRCSVMDPRDGRSVSTNTRIKVGGTTGLPASVIGVAQAPGFLGSRDNTYNVRNNVGVQAFVMDDTNQFIREAPAANVQVEIVAGLSDATNGAKLISGSQAGNRIQVATTQGIANFSLSSGPDIGSIVLRFTVDRDDNNVENGIQNPISQLLAVPVVTGSPGEPLRFEGLVAEQEQGLQVALVLEAVGGLPPYVWQVSDLPIGLSLDSEASGIITGTAPAALGDYAFEATVTDRNNTSVTGIVKFTITEKK